MAFKLLPKMHQESFCSKKKEADFFSHLCYKCYQIIYIVSYQFQCDMIKCLKEKIRMNTILSSSACQSL